MKNNNKGIALITALSLGLIALIIIGALLYSLMKGSSISGKSKSYQTANEAAKGASVFIMKKLLSGEDLTCNSSSCTPCPSSENSSCKIDLSIDKLGDYNIEAYLLGYEDLPTYDVYTFRVRAYKNGSPEKAEIEFVYKLQ